MRIRTTGPDLPTPDGDTVAVEYSEGPYTGQLVAYAKTYQQAQDFVELDRTAHKSFFNEGHKIQVPNAVKGQLGGIDAMGTLLKVSEDSAQEARQHLRRMARFEEMFTQMAIDRVETGPAPNILHVTWEQLARMHAEYRQCLQEEEAQKRAGVKVTHPAKDFPFQPLAAYSHKLISKRSDGSIRKVRDIYKNEMGFWTDRNGVGRIVILRDRGPGDLGDTYHQVPDQINKA